MRARVLAGAFALAAVPAGRAAAQPKIQVTTNAMVSSVTAPVVADFPTDGTTGSKSAGSITLTVSNCPGGSTCTVRISATAAPSAAADQLTWTVTNSGSGAGIACTPSPVTSVGLSPSAVVGCVASGNAGQMRSASGIIVAFRYPVSWQETAPGTYTTSGIQLQVSTQ